MRTSEIMKSTFNIELLWTWCTADGNKVYTTRLLFSVTTLTSFLRGSLIWTIIALTVWTHSMRQGRDREMQQRWRERRYWENMWDRRRDRLRPLCKGREGQWRDRSRAGKKLINLKIELGRMKMFGRWRHLLLERNKSECTWKKSGTHNVESENDDCLLENDHFRAAARLLIVH